MLRDKAKEMALHYFVWIEVRKLEMHPLLLIPGWTGFNIKVRDRVVVVESTISYSDTIDSPATDLKTAYEVLSRGCEIKNRLQLSAFVCVFDQAFYAKAMEVYWKHKELFKGIVIIMGGFHLLLMLLGVIGSRFGDAGLREIAVQSDVVAEGSVDKSLNGKQYNRAVRLHKCVYEALMRLLLKEFESSVQSLPILNLEQLKLELNQEEFERVLSSREFREFGEQFHVYVQGIKEKGSNLGRFWLSYLELCELMLNLIFASRTDDWQLYLSCIEEVIPWAFAYDARTTHVISSHFWTTCVTCLSECQKCTQSSTKASFPFKWGPVILLDETRLTKPLRTPLIATARQEEATLGLVLILLQLRNGCSMTQGVLCTENFLASICRLILPSRTSTRS